MSLSEVAEKLKKQQLELVPEWARLAQQSQTAHQVVVDTQTLVAHHENQVRTELALIAPAVTALQAVLQQGFGQIQARLDACDGQVAELKGLTQSAQQELAAASNDMRDKSDQLGRTLPDVKASLQKLLESQRELLAKDRQDHQEAQQRLRATLELLNRTVQTMTGESEAHRVEADAHVTTCSERSASSIREMATARDAFGQQTTATTQSYRSALTELLDSALKPGSQRLAEQTVQGLTDQVLGPARAAVDDLRTRALEALEAQAQGQMPELTQQRKTMDGTLKELAGGPQLLQLLKKAKPVLQRIGKLQALGLQNI